MNPKIKKRRFARLFSAVLTQVYRPVKFVLKPVLGRYPRINRCCIGLKEAVKKLTEPGPSSIAEPSSPPPPVESPPVEPPPVEPPPVEPLPSPISPASPRVPDWLVSEWRAIHEIEPLLFPEKHIVESIHFYRVPSTRIAKPYLDLCALIGDDATHVFLIPWIKKGGADLETLNYLQALADESFGARVVVLATENSDSPWKTRVPANVHFIDFGARFSGLAPTEQQILLARALLQLSPPIVHNINSHLGYRVFVNYGAALTHASRLFASVFCGDVSEEGRDVGYSFSFLNDCYEHLTAIMGDNQTHLDHLTKTYAMDPRRLHVHYQPAPEVEVRKVFRGMRQRDKTQLNVLWAGRIDRQKRPDLLVATARRCQHMPVHFHVYGTAVLGADIYGEQLRQLENATCYGTFDGLPSLPIEDYDAYLYTSQWDGLPNVLLEAMALGLPVISAHVGGIGELIDSGKNGLLVDPYDDADQYVAHLAKIIDDPSLLATMATNALHVLATKHSWETFRNRIRSVPSYVPEVARQAVIPIRTP